MADKKKYLDFEGLGFYHQKSQEIVDKKINWDNLKNKPFGISTTDVLYTGGTPESQWTDLDYEGLGFGNYDLDTQFTFKVNGEEPPKGMEFFSEMYEGSYIVYTYGAKEFLDTPDPVNDSIIALRWNKIEGEEYARIKLPDYQDINNFEIIVKGLDKEVINKIDKKYLPLKEVELGDLKDALIAPEDTDDKNIVADIKVTINALESGGISLNPETPIHYYDAWENGVWLSFNGEEPELAASLLNQQVTIQWDDIMVSGTLTGNTESPDIHFEGDGYAIYAGTPDGFGFDIDADSEDFLLGEHTFKIFLGDASDPTPKLNPTYLNIASAGDVDRLWGSKLEVLYIQAATHALEDGIEKIECKMSYTDNMLDDISYIKYERNNDTITAFKYPSEEDLNDDINGTNISFDVVGDSPRELTQEEMSNLSYEVTINMGKYGSVKETSEIGIIK